MQWEAPGRAPSAMAGLVAGISGAVVPVIVPAVLAWWLGRSTRHEITDSQGQLSGRGFSTAAFVLAGYSLLATIALVSSAL